ncbi:MAG: peptide chain release factor N(5)-glutamine methyltransferase [Tannerella sp.]|jgi:release factor glutamine methyltransferase|nr:peptide chain release factor N(5)-glutamine methyltransferase [Tannerella sp.]
MHETKEYIVESLKTLYRPEEIGCLTRRILQKVCGYSFPQQIMRKDTQLSDMEKETIRPIVQRLKNHEPLQYIFGEVEFYGLLLEVNPTVLIPRPETEELVKIILQTQPAGGLRVLDVGTGSGCLAVTLAKRLAGADVSAIDVSEAALETARRNALRNDAPVRFIQADILADTLLDELPVFDMIVSNPPYVMEREKAGMKPNVLEYEPHLALFVPDDDPLLFYRRIADIGLEKLKPNGLLYFEINRSCGDMMEEMLTQKGFRGIERTYDLCGNERFIKASR